MFKTWVRKLPKRVFIFAVKTATIVSLIALVLGVVVAWSFWKRASAFDLTRVGGMPERSAVYDTNGHVYAYLQGEDRIAIPLSKAPKEFLDALLAREDARLYAHPGIDFRGMLRAFAVNLRGSGIRQGASTLTQQLARNSFGMTARTLDRKLLEIALSLRIERHFTKRQILEAYINRVYFGSGVYGLERAAQVYFGKNAEALTLSESALLAGLIRSPNRMSPLHNLAGALAQRDEVLNRMLVLGMINREAVERARAASIRLVGRRQLPSQRSYVMDAVRRDLDLILTQDQIDWGGLRIYTTLDPTLQRVAEQAVNERATEFEANPEWPHTGKAAMDEAINAAVATPNACALPTLYLQAALVAVDNRTGGIRALVGGRDYAQSQFDRASLGRRQAGSTFKPFVYATAFQHGLMPGSLVRDSRIRPGEFRDIMGRWSPENSDGEYGGWYPAAHGLIASRNTMSVRVGEYAGLDAVRRTARRVGLGDDVPPFPGIFLGGFETTLKDLTTAYTVFPNRGERLQSHLIARIATSGGKIVFQVSHARVHALGRGTAWMTSELLRKVLTVGTGAKAGRLGLTKPAGGKTGTTNAYRDAWFIGYTTSLTCGVWVGFDRPQTIVEKGYGAALALPIWIDFVQSASESDYPARPLASPERLARVRLCAVSGLLSTPGCARAQSAYPCELPPALVPGARCTEHDSLVPIVAAMPLTPAATPRPCVALIIPPERPSTDRARPQPQSIRTTAAGRPTGVLRQPGGR